MRLLTATCLLSLLMGHSSVLSPKSVELVTLADSLFDQYGAIDWENEKARLDNFAIQLLQDEKLVGYILVFDSVTGCAGEAQARAIRAKQYLVEHRGVAWNRVIWRSEGHQDGIATILQPVPPGVVLPYPFLDSPPAAAKDKFPIRACKARLERIRRSRW